MKKLHLQSADFEQYQKSFGQWLSTIGMAQQAQYYMPLHVREMFCFMEGREVYTVRTITVKDIKDYFHHLATRTNERRGGGISVAHYNKQIQALRKFEKYLWYHDSILLPLRVKRKVSVFKYPVVLTELEISDLYKATEQNQQLELRDKVMLDLLYGCGLRKTEALHVHTEDVYLEKRLLYVRRGKNYSKRYVPFTNSAANRMSEYLSWHRQDLLKNKNVNQLLVSTHGKHFAGESMFHRIKALTQKSNCFSLQSKQIGLHTLRHSIATHLLHRGLPLQQISRFLGHKSIESTQIYTHLIHELG